MSPRIQSSKLNERFLSGSGSCPGESCPSSLTCTIRFPGLGSRHSPLASLMRRAADFTNLVGSVEQGYATVLAIEGSHSCAPLAEFHPLLPSKPVMHEDAVSSPLLRPGSCPSLQGDVQRGDPPLIHFTPLPLSAFLHTWRDLLGVLPWILRTIQFGYTLQFELTGKTKPKQQPA